MSARVGRLLVLPVALLVAACGSTVQVRGTLAVGPSGAASGDGVTATDGPGLSGPSGATPPGATGSRGSAPVAGPLAPSGRPAAQATTGPGVTTQQPGRSPANVQGLTATTIRLGVLTVNSYNGLANSAGIKGAQLGDQVALAKAVIGYVNSHGGLAGRRIEPVYYDVDLGRYASNQSAEAAVACDRFTQDAHVYAVAALVAWGGKDFYACLQKRGVVAAAPELSTESMLRALPETLYVPSDANYTRQLRDSVQALARASWFGTAPKVGILGVDTPESRDTVERGARPALKAQGISLATEPVYLSPGTGGASEYSNAVLRFRSAGVDRVLFAQGASILLFAQQAQSQGYYPRYAVDSRNSPGGQLQSTLQPRTLRGAMGLGWVPTLDVGDWAKHPTPGQAECLQAAKASGEDLTQAGSALVAFWTCDNLFFLRDVLAKAQLYSASGFRAAAESLGSTFRPAATFASRFAASLTHDGADTYRLNAFRDDCSCFAYVGKPFRSERR